MKKWTGNAIKFLVSGGLLYYLFQSKTIDIDSVMERLVQADLLMLTVACGIFIFQLIICVIRWQAVMTAIKAPLPFIKAFRIFYIGVFFSQILPGAVGGDAVRIYRTYRVGLTLGNAINGVMLERAATVIALLIVVSATMPFLMPRVGEDSAAWVLPGVVMFSAAAVAGLALLMVLDRLPESFRRWRFVRFLAALAADTRTVFLSPIHAFKVLGWSCAGHLNLTLGALFLALGLNLDVTWMDCIALVPPVILITTIPISIAGWGVREKAMVTAFALIGVPDDGAIALSILFGFVGIATALPGGVVWLTSGGMYADAKAEEIVHEAEEAMADAASGDLDN